MTYKGPQRPATKDRVRDRLAEGRRSRLQKWATNAVRTPPGALLVVDRQVAVDVLDLLEET